MQQYKGYLKGKTSTTWTYQLFISKKNSQVPRLMACPIKFWNCPTRSSLSLVFNPEKALRRFCSRSSTSIIRPCAGKNAVSRGSSDPLSQAHGTCKDRTSRHEMNYGAKDSSFQLQFKRKLPRENNGTLLSPKNLEGSKAKHILCVFACVFACVVCLCGLPVFARVCLCGLHVFSQLPKDTAFLRPHLGIFQSVPEIKNRWKKLD